VIDQARISHETQVSEVAAAQPVMSSFQAAGGFVRADTHELCNMLINQSVSNHWAQLLAIVTGV
jgi:hypothetical protein